MTHMSKMADTYGIVKAGKWMSNYVTKHVSLQVLKFENEKYFPYTYQCSINMNEIPLYQEYKTDFSETDYCVFS